MYRLYRFMYGLVGFSRSQTNGFLIFLPLLLLILFSETMFIRLRLHPSDHSPDIARLDSLVSLMSPKKPVETHSRAGSALDPNTASKEELVELGIRADVASRIVNYRSKGGVFRVRKDLSKIWGMDSVTYRRIAPLIALPETTIRHSVPASKHPRFPATDKKKPYVTTKIAAQDLNLADTASLKKIFGIGEKLALRILKFRDGLGGFVSMAQLKDVYKLDSAVIHRIETQYFIDDSFVPRRLDINTVGQQELAAHPYLSSGAANAIVAYRLNHGEFKSIEDIRKIPSIDSIMYKKVRPYLKLKHE